MSHKVRLTREAKEQIAAISAYIAQDSPTNARRWRQRIREHIRSLKTFPERCEVAFRAQDVGRDIRHTFYGVYRILYTIDNDTVVVLCVRHGARRPLTLDEAREIGRIDDS